MHWDPTPLCRDPVDVRINKVPEHVRINRARGLACETVMGYLMGEGLTHERDEQAR